MVFGQAREKSTAVKREAGSFSSTGLFVSSADFFSLQLDETADNSSLKLATTAGRFSCAENEAIWDYLVNYEISSYGATVTQNWRNTSHQANFTSERYLTPGTSHSKCWRQVGLGRDGRLCDVARPEM